MLKNNDPCILSKKGFPSVYLGEKGYYIKYVNSIRQCGFNLNEVYEILCPGWYPHIVPFEYEDE